MHALEVYEVILYFFLYGFCGWVCECIFCSLQSHRLVNRGFVSGPICPIYGFGGLVVVYLLAPLRGNILLLFLCGMICTTILEYVTSWMLEKLFDTSWWDYHDLPLNINGRVCLRFSLMFGALSVVAVRLLYPPFVHMMALIPMWSRPWIAWALLLTFSVDVGVTVHSILALNGKLAELSHISEELRQKLQDSNQTLQERLEQLRLERSEHSRSLRERLESLAERLEALRGSASVARQNRRLMDAFPRMRSLHHHEQLTELKSAWEQWKKRGNSKKTSNEQET